MFASKMTKPFGLKHFSMALLTNRLFEFSAHPFRQMQSFVGSVVELEIDKRPLLTPALVVGWVGCHRTGTLIQSR